ncbi:ImmA/IrrE family metallo-endopeptidase [Salmonella enterica subsp. diarizonae serovar 61:l,v:1,5,7]|uniref:ImmA/IrrE family metallo-endopeptidase n=1 Tax=Enterobacter mori TaxID=539813 RepID=UPI0026E22909|nr:ImmA/IrrE family metallo-endopeptidase [Enterobacter mori]EDX3145018.1 ImmA/IrrE family metallo-endopeptidase [Salmonella enterica subsp. diarizonae serovar 61:l,v:1,5,7]WKW38377.1 ImmA/IrrE family metallo-endopeptidase [Enterobacter mori]
MNHTVNTVLDRYWDRQLPIDPKKIAEAWGARVEEITDSESDYDNDGLSGIAVIKKGVPRIYYSPSDHPNRQRFTIAHELAHHVLGHTKEGEKHRDSVADYSTGAKSHLEIEANKFAAALLMPEVAIRTLITREGVSTTLELARIFKVSEAAMHWRLKEIGLAY